MASAVRSAVLGDRPYCGEANVTGSSVACQRLLGSWRSLWRLRPCGHDPKLTLARNLHLMQASNPYSVFFPSKHSALHLRQRRSVDDLAAKAAI
jgi:hypothetical protein